MYIGGKTRMSISDENRQPVFATSLVRNAYLLPDNCCLTRIAWLEFVGDACSLRADRSFQNAMLMLCEARAARQAFNSGA